MYPEIIIATHNQHKLVEIKNIFGTGFNLLSLNAVNYNQPIPEPYHTLEENAFIKAQTIFQEFKKPCFSEDTGLFIEALNGEPGVFSARYAGIQATAEQNIQKVMQLMVAEDNRKAYFKTVVCLIIDESPIYFEGRMDGNINQQLSGENGFGYDAIFIPHNAHKTFAQMELAEKNKYSHRMIAINKLKNHLIQFYEKT